MEGRNLIIKRFRPLFIIFILMFMVTGCTEKEAIKTADKTRQVTVVTMKNQAFRETLRYTGFVSASQIIPVSFSVDGVVESVDAQEGQTVEAGDILMTLEATGGPGDAMGKLYAPMNGIVAAVIPSEGDLVGAGYPAVVVRSEKQIVKVGVTDKDLKRIEDYSNPEVSIQIGDKTVKAKVDALSKLPDESTRLYSVTLSLDSDDAFLMGEMATASIELSRIRGVWLPISNIQNDGEDYVYIVNADNRVERRNLKLKELNSAHIRVEGLGAGDRVITVGNSFVKEGQLVIMREAADE